MIIHCFFFFIQLLIIYSIYLLGLPFPCGLNNQYNMCTIRFHIGIIENFSKFKKFNILQVFTIETLVPIEFIYLTLVAFNII